MVGLGVGADCECDLQGSPLWGDKYCRWFPDGRNVLMRNPASTAVRQVRQSSRRPACAGAGRGL